MLQIILTLMLLLRRAIRVALMNLPCQCIPSTLLKAFRFCRIVSSYLLFNQNAANSEFVEVAIDIMTKKMHYQPPDGSASIFVKATQEINAKFAEIERELCEKLSEWTIQRHIPCSGNEGLYYTSPTTTYLFDIQANKLSPDPKGTGPVPSSSKH